jgi:c-di-AMP phosphodiesterase-like protein
MPKFLLKHVRGIHVIAIFSASLIMLSILAWYSWKWGLVGFMLFAILGFMVFRAEKSFQMELEQYIATLTYRIKKVGEDVISELPFGIILYDEEKKVQWHNKYLLELIEQESPVLGKALDDVIPKLDQWLESEEKEGMIRYNNLNLQITHRAEERLIYLFDHTEHHQLQLKHRQGQAVFINIHLDNLDEVTQGLDEQRRVLLVSDVTRVINEWAQDLGIHLKRTNTDKFFGIMTEQNLRRLEDNKFEIIDTIRDLTSKNKIPVTLSIGIGAGTDSFSDLGELSQSSLDIALGRGGDQAAVKRDSGKITFYGGKSNAVEKRTRVRARVISHALRDIIKESDRVFIMGHRDPDMDSIGSSIGVLKAVEANQKEGYIILDQSERTPGIDRLMVEVEKDEKLLKHFILPSDALELKTERSLLVIVDVHKPSLLIESKLVDQIHRRVVIDHHRRGEEFIPDPLLVYMEPYASSTSELVTELLEYQSQNIQMSVIEATSMLAGIVVDTNSFAFRTGSRTFEAASYLRQHGADTSLVQKLLKEDIDQFVKRAKIVEKADIYRDQIAIAVGETDQKYGQVLLAQAADTLLKMNQVTAAFVISQRANGLVTISARSLGELNVQMIMEKMEGGGHLTNAATQLEDTSVEEVLEWLKEVIDEYLEGGTRT